MFELLKVPDEKLKGKMIETVKERVTSVSAAVGRDVGFEEVLELLKKGFLEAFPVINFVPGELSEGEKTLAAKLAKEKYGSEEWNRKR